MGLTRAEINEKLEDVIEFSELGDFINLPVRTYSSGMLLRLGFAVSTSITANILIMDEWLSTGDDSFAKKAESRLYDLVNASEILVIASHSKELIQRVCNKIVWLDQGSIRQAGATDQVLPLYWS
jgi:lipopolysaccharide transport system ATP-binding protein